MPLTHKYTIAYFPGLVQALKNSGGESITGYQQLFTEPDIISKVLSNSFLVAFLFWMKTLNTSYLKCVFWRYNVLRNNNVFIHNNPTNDKDNIYYL